jgi:hypothetical protein
LVEALKALKELFAEPSPFYIKKLGAPITKGDQDKIDAAFVKLDRMFPRLEAEWRQPSLFAPRRIP